MKQNLQTITTPFPAGLMSSARNPATMGNNYARELLNLYTSRGGAGAKRNGFSPVVTGCPASITCLMPYMNSTGALQILAAASDGKIYLLNAGIWTEVYTGLNTQGKMRWVQFAGKLILCNGLDPVLSWDGTNISIVKQWVADIAPGLTFVNATTVQINSSLELYPVGKPLRLRLGVGNYVYTTVAGASVLSGVVTITLNTSVATAALDELAYEMQPPTFQYIYAAHDRLWGLGEGVLKANSFSASEERTTVFYTAGTNDETAWYDNEGLLPFINLADKMPVADELLGMAVKDGITSFFGRNSIQLWSGDVPGVDGNFVWQKNIPVGVVHADLICEMPADVAFFTRYGARTLSRVLQTEQLDIGDLGAEIAPSISSAMSSLTASDTSYMSAYSCRYERQGWFAFHVAGKCFVFQATSNGAGWTEFDGLFSEATAFMNAPDGKLYLAKDTTLYCYDEASFSDDEAPIAVRWWTPWFVNGANRWANKYLELITESDANTVFNVKRFKNYDGANAVTYNLETPGKGDYWDTAYWDNTDWDMGSVRPGYIRDGFIGDAYAYIFENISSYGPIQVLGMRMHGKEER